MWEIRREQLRQRVRFSKKMIEEYIKEKSPSEYRQLKKIGELDEVVKAKGELMEQSMMFLLDQNPDLHPHIARELVWEDHCH